MMSLIRCLLAVGAMAGIVSTQTVANCPSSVPRDQYTLVYKNQCFQFVMYNTKDYPDAETDCENRGGTLALAKTTEVQQFLQKAAVALNIQEEPLWIGLNDREDENSFVWEDGTAVDATQGPWANGSGPREGLIAHRIEDCVGMDTSQNGAWIDYHCENELFGFVKYEKHYICSFPITPL